MDINNVKEVAKGVLETSGKHIPQFIFIKKGNKVDIGVTPFSNNLEKEFIKNSMRKYVEKNKPIKYFYICEGQATILSSDLKEVKWKKELLIISEFCNDMTGGTILIEFEKSESGKIIWGKEEHISLNYSSSAFNFYLEKGSHEEKVNNIYKNS